MAKIVSLISQKGGVGKTTLCLQLYWSFIESGAKCILVDLDEQGSLMNLKLQGKGIEVTTLAELPKKEFQIAIIDTPPYIFENFSKVVKQSDLILVPIKSSLIDSISAIQTFTELKASGGEDKSFALINMTIANTSFDKEVKDMLTDAKVPFLKSQIGNRVSFNRCQFNSTSIFKEKDRKAKEEVKSFAMEVYNKLLNN